MMGSDHGIAPVNDGPGNDAYRTMRELVAQQTVAGRRR